MTKFKESYNQFENLSQMAQARAKELQELLRTAEKEHEEAEKALRRLEKFKRMAKHTTAIQWIEKPLDAVYQQDKYNWRKTHNLSTGTLTATIMTGERSDLKRLKYEVSVSGSTETLNALSWQSGYTDHEAIKHCACKWDKGENGRYDWIKQPDYLETNKKFSTVEQAEAFVSQWKELIENRFAERIQADKETLKLALDHIESESKRTPSAEELKQFGLKIMHYGFKEFYKTWELADYEAFALEHGANSFKALMNKAGMKDSYQRNEILEKMI